MAFLERWGPVETSPGILQQLNRYIHLQLERGWRETWGRTRETPEHSTRP